MREALLGTGLVRRVYTPGGHPGRSAPGRSRLRAGAQLLLRAAQPARDRHPQALPLRRAAGPAAPGTAPCTTTTGTSRSPSWARASRRGATKPAAGPTTSRPPWPGCWAWSTGSKEEQRVLAEALVAETKARRDGRRTMSETLQATKMRLTTERGADFWNDSCAPERALGGGAERRGRRDLESRHRLHRRQGRPRHLDARSGRARGVPAGSGRGGDRLGAHRDDGAAGGRAARARLSRDGGPQGLPVDAGQPQAVPQRRAHAGARPPAGRAGPQHRDQGPGHSRGHRGGRGAGGLRDQRERHRELHPPPGPLRGRGLRGRASSARRPRASTCSGSTPTSP